MTNIIRLEQKLNNTEILYSLDKYSNFGILTIYNLDLNFKELKSELLQKYSLTDIQVVYKSKNELEILESINENIIEIEENNIKYLLNLKDKYLDYTTDKSELRKLINEYSKNKNVLDLIAYKGQFSINCNLNALSLTTVELDSNNTKIIEGQFKINNLKLPDIWEFTPLEFIDFAIESNTKFDLIILDFSMYNLVRLKDFNINSDLTNLIRKIQRKILNYAGIIIFFTDNVDFAMDKYIRTGADKLTNQLVPKSILPLKPNQIFAFYN